MRIKHIYKRIFALIDDIVAQTIPKLSISPLPEKKEHMFFEERKLSTTIFDSAKTSEIILWILCFKNVDFQISHINELLNELGPDTEYDAEGNEEDWEDFENELNENEMEDS